MTYVEEIKRFVPASRQEERDRDTILEYISLYPETILTRECETAHLTASSMIFNRNRDRVLMVYHNIYDSWSWTGGHADGEADLGLVARREAQEETGIVSLRLISGLVSLDVLPVKEHWKRGKCVAAHLHLNFSYLFEASEEEALRIKADENSGVKWLPADRLAEYVTETEMLPLYEKLIARGRKA